VARILYVTGLWSGLADVLYEHSSPRGMPGFIRPLRRLIEKGHHVDLMVLNALPRALRIGVDWLEPDRISIVSPRLRWAGRLGAAIGFYGQVLARLKQREYEFVYGQGTMGALGVLAANRVGVTSAQRLYGISYFSREFQRGSLSSIQRLAVFLRHPLHYMSFSLPKAFLLATNDGTRADEVYRQIGNRAAALLYWLNGVDIADSQGGGQAQPTSPAGTDILLYPGRIDRFKRQHLAVELMARLKERGDHGFRLVFAGHGYDQKYRAELEAAIEAKSLASCVEFAGPVTREKLQEMYQSCFAVLSFYDVSNLSNVALEALASGAPLISLADGTLDTVAKDGESALLVADVEQAAEAVSRLRSTSGLRGQISHRAREAAAKQLASWDERVAREVKQIELAIAAGGSSGRRE
jgi:glycosyltransferase involved in cell wall biosynthesis